MLEAERLVKEENIVSESFVFSYGDENEWIKVVYGVFETYEEADKVLVKLKNLVKKYEPVIERIEIKQKLYKQYAALNEKENIQEEIENTEKEEEVSIESVLKNDNISFEEEFLNAPKEYYTINLATLFSDNDAKRFYSKHSDKLKLFVFKFGIEKEYFKAMQGVFKSEEEANEAISLLPLYLQKNKPRIEKIYIKQKLYNKYNKKLEKMIPLEEV